MISVQVLGVGHGRNAAALQLHHDVPFSQHRPIRSGVSSPSPCHPAIQEWHICFLRRIRHHRRRTPHHWHLVFRGLQSRHGLPDRPRSVRALFSRSVPLPLAQGHDSSPARDHRTRPVSSCRHWRPVCCWCWQRRRSHGSSRRCLGACFSRWCQEYCWCWRRRRSHGSSRRCLGGACFSRWQQEYCWCSRRHRTHASRPTRERDHRNHAGCLSRRCLGASWSRRQEGSGCQTCWCSRHEEGSGCWTCWCSRRRWRPGACSEEEASSAPATPRPRLPCCRCRCRCGSLLHDRAHVRNQTKPKPMRAEQASKCELQKSELDMRLPVTSKASAASAALVHRRAGLLENAAASRASHAAN